MLTLTIALLAAAAPQAAPDMPVSGRIPAHCRAGDGLAALPGPRVGGAQKLNEQPPANAYYALWRRGPDGCPDPIVLRKGLGAPAAPRNDAVPVPRPTAPR